MMAFIIASAIPSVDRYFRPIAETVRTAYMYVINVSGCSEQR